MKKAIQFTMVLGIISVMLTGCQTTSSNVPLTDNELAVAVQTRLDDDAVTAPFDFGITVLDGVVYFKGSAPPKNSIRARAVSIALGTPGVLEVVDELYPPTNGMY